MLNFRVADLDGLLAQLRAGGVTVEKEVQRSEYGAFGWCADGEGKPGRVVAAAGGRGRVTGNLDCYKMIDNPRRPSSDSPDTKVDALVDQRFGFVISRVITNGTFKQDESLAYMKDQTEPGRRVLLKLDKHPGAKVVAQRS